MEYELIERDISEDSVDYGDVITDERGVYDED